MIVNKVDHVHLIVSNLDETAKAFEKILGLKPWSLGIKDLPGLRQTMLTPKDGARIELVQPTSDSERFYKVLKERGDGVYGLSIFIENFDEEVKKLKEKGVRVEEQTVEFLFPGHPFRLAWVPPEEGQMVWLELVDMEVLPEFEKAWEFTDGIIP